MISHRPWPCSCAAMRSQCRRAGRLSGNGGSRSVEIVAPYKVLSSASGLTGLHCVQDQRSTRRRHGRGGPAALGIYYHPLPLRGTPSVLSDRAGAMGTTLHRLGQLVRRSTTVLADGWCSGQARHLHEAPVSLFCSTSLRSARPSGVAFLSVVVPM
jgi:hypothetical protein